MTMDKRTEIFSTPQTRKQYQGEELDLSLTKVNI